MTQAKQKILARWTNLHDGSRIWYTAKRELVLHRLASPHAGRPKLIRADVSPEEAQAIVRGLKQVYRLVNEKEPMPAFRAPVKRRRPGQKKRKQSTMKPNPNRQARSSSIKAAVMNDPDREQRIQDHARRVRAEMKRLNIRGV